MQSYKNGVQSLRIGALFKSLEFMLAIFLILHMRWQSCILIQSTYLAVDNNNYNKAPFIGHELYFGYFTFNFLIL